MSDRLLVLVIEDSERIRKWMMDALESAGYRVLGAETAMEAVRLARARQPDLILVDLGLPDQDGGVTVSCLKEYGGFEAIPVVLVSGLPEESLRERARDTGAVAYLRKPFSPRALLECAERWIAASGAG